MKYIENIKNINKKTWFVILGVATIASVPNITGDEYSNYPTNQTPVYPAYPTNQAYPVSPSTYPAYPSSPTNQIYPTSPSTYPSSNTSNQSYQGYQERINASDRRHQQALDLNSG